MPTPKQAAEAMLHSLPDDASVEDLKAGFDRFYVLKQIELGETSLEDEGGLTTEEARARLGKWLAN